MAKKAMAMLGLTLIFYLYFPLTTLAKGFFEHQNTIIAENQSVNDVVVVGGSATVSGNVENFVIVINGEAIIKSTAHVKGMVLVIGGTITQDTGSVIDDDTISISLDNSTKNSLLIGSGLLVSIWILQLLTSLLFIALPMLLVFLMKYRLQPFVQLVKNTSGRALGIGFFSCLFVSALIILLFITVIGIPLILIILFMIALIVLLGVTALGLILGEKIQIVLPHKPLWFTTGIGATIIVSLMNIPIIGLIIMLAMIWLSFGIVTMWGYGKLIRKSRKK